MFKLGMKLAAGALLVALTAGCTTQAGTVTDVHTGVSAKHSAGYSAHAGLLDNMNVVAAVGTHAGVTKYGLSVNYSSTGLGWAFFREAWSFGKRLPYNVTQEQVAGCGGGCTMVENGSIELSKSEFEAAAKSGLEFKLVGKNRSVVGKVPAKAFAEALAQK